MMRKKRGHSQQSTNVSYLDDYDRCPVCGKINYIGSEIPKCKNCGNRFIVLDMNPDYANGGYFKFFEIVWDKTS